jgi:hypothetical protein
MGGLNPFLNELVASARVAADGTTNGAGFFARGCVAALPGGAGTGIYTMTLDRAIDADQSVIDVAVETADVSVSVVHTTDLVKTITCRSIANPPAAADSICEFSIRKVAGGGGSTGL